MDLRKRKSLLMQEISETQKEDVISKIEEILAKQKIKSEYEEPDVNLPFFTYGIFRPGEIPFLGIKNFVDKVETKTIEGSIRVRDGVFLYKNGNQDVDGYLLSFKEDSQKEAYNFINSLEPHKLFRWKKKKNFNILVGRSPNKGSESIEEMFGNEHSTLKDPYFTTGLGLLDEFIIPNQDDYFQSSFKIQMHYMFLWTIIERFTFLRYSLGKGPNQRINLLSENTYYKEALQSIVKRTDKIYSTETLQDKKLDKNKPKNSIQYYYQVRSNLTHRGKGIIKDYIVLKKSYSELLKITEHILKKTIEECHQIKVEYEL